MCVRGTPHHQSSSYRRTHDVCNADPIHQRSAITVERERERMSEGSKEINDLRRLVEISDRSKDLDLQARIALQNKVEDAASRYATGECDTKGDRIVRTESEERKLREFRAKQQRRYLNEIVKENVEDMGMESDEALDDAFEQLEAQYGRSNMLVSKAEYSMATSSK